MGHMDLYDRKILKLLIENSRYSVTSIAKAVRLSKDSVRNRIRKMEEQQIFPGYSVLFNPQGFGYTVNHLLLKLKSLDDERATISRLTSHKNVTFVSSHNGSFDLQVIFHAKDIFQKEQIIRQILSYMGNKVKDFRYVEHVKDYNFSFLFGDVDVKIEMERKNDSSFAKQLQDVKGFLGAEFDDTDKRIMRQLSLNSRQSLTQIGKEVGMTSEGVKKRISSIIRKGVIAEFTLFPDYMKFGYLQYMLLFKIDNLPGEVEKKLKTFLQTRNVLYAARFIGAYNLFVYLLAKDPVDFSNNQKELKSILDDHVIQYDLSVLTEVHKFVMINDEFLG